MRAIVLVSENRISPGTLEIAVCELLGVLVINSAALCMLSSNLKDK